ncbi:hypothetical protein LEP1GSC042_1484 [Leptospira kirschneri serovar Bim str. PUO 1247]|nr:hypothetical protein LEP1GSC042_1484 [Leptospira kirschneri serovar Bim str. PUO 1247]
MDASMTFTILETNSNRDQQNYYEHFLPITHLFYLLFSIQQSNFL